MKKIILLTVLAAGIAGVKADEVFQASLTPDIALHSSSTQINGLCLSIWGENPQHGVALGLVNVSTGDSAGFSWGLVNFADTYTGVAWAPVNVSNDKFVGWQGGFANISREFHGLQTGIVNYTENLRGIQIGLINVAENNPWFDEMPNKLAPAFPFVNWSF
jgi:hypothetical protein